MTNQGVLICHRSLCGWLAGRPQEASTSLLQRLDRCVCSRELAEVSVHHPLFVYRSNRTCYHASKQHSCNGVLFGSFPQSAVVNSSELALRIGEHVVHCFSFAIDAIVVYRFHYFSVRFSSKRGSRSCVNFDIVMFDTCYHDFAQRPSASVRGVFHEIWEEVNLCWFVLQI